jgi:predicted nuclease of predicted toxin-antitoxin system
MKLLFDQNLSFKLCRQLNDLFPGSSQVRLLGLERADMAGHHGTPPKVIRPRCGNQSTAAIVALLRDRAEAMVHFEQDDSACLEIY